jgi:hypothetical protein
VTSIDVSGGTTGLTTSGGPVTTSGTITLAGTLNVANGGTGATTLTSGYLLKGNGTSAVSASVVYDTGTNVGIGTASPQALFTISSGAGTKAVWQTTRSFTVNRNFQLAVDEYVEGAFTITPSTTLGGSTYTTPTVAVTGAGNLGVGTTAPVSKFHVSVNAGTLPPTSSAEQILTVSGADGASTRVLIDAFGGNPGIHTRRANGTAAAPTAVLAGNYLGFLSSWGYGTTAYAAGSQVRIGLMASENWTDTARGTHLVFDTTTNGSTALAERMRIDNAGNVGINTASPAGRLHALGPAGADVLYRLEPAYTYASKLLISSVSSGDGGIRYGTSNDLNVLTYSTMTFNTGAISGGLGTERLTINISGNVTANVDIRSPIFYDSNDTAYFLDASSTGTALSTNGILIAGTGTSGGVQNRTYTAGRNRIWSFANADTYGISYFQGGPDYIGLHVAGTATQAGSDFWVSSTGIAQVRNEMRAPIYYDSANTAYYVDPASGSVLNRLVSITGAGNTNGGNLQLGDKDVNTAKWSVLTGAHYGGTSEPKGVMLIGSYSASGANQVSIGGNVYEANPATQIVFFTATTATHPTGGTSRLSIDGNGVVTANVDIRAPIFYDSNDTGYYIDPNGNTRLNQLLLAGSIATINNFSPANSAIRLTPNLHLNATAGNAVILNWDNGTTSGLTFRIGNGAGSDVFTTYANGATYAPILYDISNSAYYVDPAGSSVLGIITAQSSNDAQLYLNGNGTSWAGIQWTDVSASDNMWYNGSTSTFAIGGGGSIVANKKLHINGGTTIGSGLAATASGTNSLLVEASITANQLYAQIFYDSQNGAYYVDPASTSNLNVLNVQPNSTTSGGGINFNGAGNAFIRGTSTDGASSTGANLQLQSWFGIGFGPSISGQLVPIGENAVWIDARNGDLTARRILVANQDARAPIFYDNNNTAYYGDFAGVTNLADLRAPNVVHYPGWPGFPGIDANAYGFNAISSFTYANNAPYTGPFVSFAAGGYNLQLNAPYSGAGYGLAFRTRNGDTSSFNPWRYPAVYDVNVNGGGALYATIYYDQNNTAFYVDPNSTGTSLNVAGNIIGVGELRTSGQITNANYMVGGSQNGAVNIGRIDLNYRWEGTVWGSTTTLGLLANCLDYWEFGIHDSGSKVVSPLYYDGGARFLMGRDIGWGTTYIEAASNFRAPLFYDSNNTAYYLDPAATSVLNQAQFVNRISIGDGNGTPFLNAGSPGVWLSYNGGVNIFMGSESSTVAGFYIAGDWRLRVNSSGDVTAGGNVTAYSDARLKKDVETIGDALGLVRKMRGVTYTRIDTDKAGVGVIAQEMLEVMPQVVQQGIGEDDTLSVAYGNLVGVLIEAIKELEARVAHLEGK